MKNERLISRINNKISLSVKLAILGSISVMMVACFILGILEIRNMPSPIHYSTIIDSFFPSMAIGSKKVESDLIVYKSSVHPLFVGDSRTEGMSLYISDINSMALAGSGYSYLSTIDSDIRKSDADCVIIGFGVNDLSSIQNYIDYANALGRDMDVPVFYLTVNPVEEKRAQGNGYSIDSDYIEDFNELLTENAMHYRIINTYDYLIEDGFATTDGLHYDKETYIKIYNYVMNEIEKNM